MMPPILAWSGLFAEQHGIRSPAPVVLGIERAEDWEEHRDGVLESLSPEGHLETVLAERVALLCWRLNRVTRYETEVIALSQEKMEGDMAEWNGWTVSLVRECISAKASVAGEDEQVLIEVATEQARLDTISAKAAAERVEQDLARMSRERPLPNDKALEKIGRYEGHLSRGLYKALHELEALQVRRSGGSAPLARLDVEGPPGS
jgi:hypothetical protein